MIAFAIFIIFNFCDGFLVTQRHLQDYRLAFRICSMNIADAPKDINRKCFEGKGCVLVSKVEEYDRSMSKSVILIFEHSAERGTQGVIINKVRIVH